ncbi:transposase [Nonomuraea wenchangensis]
MGRFPLGARWGSGSKWQLALDMLDELAGWGQQPPLVVADAGYGDVTALRLGLSDRGLPYVVGVRGTTSVYAGDAVPEAAPYSGTGRRPVAKYRDKPSSLRELVLAAGRPALHRITWRHGSKRTKGNPTARMTSRFIALRVRPANRDIPRQADGHLPDCWLLAEWPPGEPPICSSPNSADQPKSLRGGLTFYKILHMLQVPLATWSGRCPTCRQRPPLRTDKALLAAKRAFILDMRSVPLGADADRGTPPVATRSPGPDRGQDAALPGVRRLTSLRSITFRCGAMGGSRRRSSARGRTPAESLLHA